MAGGSGAADATRDMGGVLLKKQIARLVGNTCWKSR
jgi:hypothetical protein